MKETILNSSDDDFIPLEAVNNLEGGEIIENLFDNEDKIIPGPELGDMGFNALWKLQMKIKVLWKITFNECKENVTKATHSELQLTV